MIQLASPRAWAEKFTKNQIDPQKNRIPIKGSVTKLKEWLLMPTYHTYRLSILITNDIVISDERLPTPEPLCVALGELTAKQCQQHRQTPEARERRLLLSCPPVSRTRTCQACHCTLTLHGADHPAAGHSRASPVLPDRQQTGTAQCITKGTWYLEKWANGRKAHTMCTSKATAKQTWHGRGVGRRDSQEAERTPRAEAQGRRRWGLHRGSTCFSMGWGKTEDPGQGCSL